MVQLFISIMVESVFIRISIRIIIRLNMSIKHTHMIFILISSLLLFSTYVRQLLLNQCAFYIIFTTLHFAFDYVIYIGTLSKKLINNSHSPLHFAS